MPSRELQPRAEVAPNGTGVHHNSGTRKKHKQLPHPRRNGSGDYSTATSSNTNSGTAPRGLSLETDVTSPSAVTTSSTNASPRTLKHASRRIIGSIDLPPTPPAHSRNSSNDASAGSLPIAPVTNGDIVESPTCSTPVNVQSLPTPDFTPPRPRRVEAIQGLGKLPREGAVRREMGSRNDSMNTTTSFVTAKEELEEETDASTIRPQNSSPIDGMDYELVEDLREREEPPKMKSLGLGLQGLEDPLARHRTPTKDGTPLSKKFSFEHDFDGEFSPDGKNGRNGGVKEGENPILSRNVTITRGKPRRKPYILDNDTPTKQHQEHRRRHSQPQHQHLQAEVVEDRVLGTSNAIRHLKEHGISEVDSDFVRPTPRHSRQEEDMARTHRRSHTQPERISPLHQARQDPRQLIQQDPYQDARKFSNGSHRSNSTVEAVVMIQPQQLKMRRTLRHKERMGSLRDFSPASSPASRLMNGGVREPVQRLRHKSVDLLMRNMEDGRVKESSRKTDEAPLEQRQRTASGRPLPENPRDGPDHESAPPRSRKVSEATIVAPRSRQASEQTVIEHPQEHPRRSPLPEPPSEEVVLIQLLVAPEPPRPAVQTTQAQSQPVSRPPQAIDTQAEIPKRRYSIERKPVPIRAPRPSIDSVGTTSTIQTTDSAISRSRKALLAGGIIPVVIVPRRTSSLKEQSQPPSLRSTSASRQASNKGSRASSTAPLSASAGTNIPGAWPSWTETPLSIGKRRNSDGGSVASGKATAPKEDGLVRSIDFGPPAIPVRWSSTSAPTTPMGSTNVSRSNSLTADSLRRHNEDQALAALSSHAESQRDPGPSARTVSQTIQQRRNENRDSGVGYGVGISSHGHSVRIEEPEEVERHRSTHSSVDINGDPLFGQRLSAQVTPFSARSDVTGASHGTALEVAEARQVEVFSHQNTSVQLVDQEPPSSSASESIKLRQKGIARSTGRPTTSSSTATAIRPKLQAGEKYSSTSLANPKSTSNFTISNTTNTRYPSSTVNIVPASPPQTANTFDSPLINPRQPPEVPAGPPAFKIIPPTPADLLAQEEASKQLGWEPPLDSSGQTSRPPRFNWSVKLSGLARSLSLGRRNSERGRNAPDVDVGPSLSAPLDDERPAEQDKLHPFWKPSNYRDEEEDCECEECREYWEQREQEYRAQKRNSDGGEGNGKLTRPGMPRRATSQMSAISKKMKRTFAILPIAGVQTTSSSKDDGYNVSYATARRTIKRSGSGNLKVVKRDGNVSKESLKLEEYLNLSSRRQRSFRNRLKEKRGNGTQGVGSATVQKDRPQTPPRKEEQRKRFSWVGGSTDSPASKYPPAVTYPPASSSGTYQSGPLKRTFSLPTRRVRETTGTSFPPRVQVEWLGLGTLGRRFSGKGGDGRGKGEMRREGLKRTISAPRGVRDGVEEVLTRRQREEARMRRDEGVESEDFAR